ncbi:MAG: hypothetical protein ACM359_17240 [Bacillota bacterium]
MTTAAFPSDVGWMLGAVVFAIVAVFMVAFAFKVIYLEMTRRRQLPGGFEVKIMGNLPVSEERDNDHG